MVESHTKSMPFQLLNNMNLSDISYDCRVCYGQEQPFREKCKDCIDQFQKMKRESNNNKTFVPVVGAAIHIFKAALKRYKNDPVAATVEEFKRFAESSPGVILTSQQSYQIEKVPRYYRAIMNRTKPKTSLPTTKRDKRPLANVSPNWASRT